MKIPALALLTYCTLEDQDDQVSTFVIQDDLVITAVHNNQHTTLQGLVQICWSDSTTLDDQIVIQILDDPNEPLTVKTCDHIEIQVFKRVIK